jgi:type II secretory pathway component GspD/PulD (secretin)
MKRAGVVTALFFLALYLHGQAIRKMDFRNQNIADILMVLADMGQQSVIVDESVSGTATFFFSNSEFREALYRFTDACNLFCEEKNGAYYVSKIHVVPRDGAFSVAAEDADITALVKNISRAAGRTILYDPLPRETITVHLQNSGLLEALEIIIRKYPGYSVLEENGAFYLKKNADPASSAAPGRLSSSSIRRQGDLYSMDIQRAPFSAILSLLFKTAEKEYSLLQKIDAALENLFFRDKPFDELLRLVLEQGNCDYTESGGIYRIFEIQRRDVLKNFKEIMVLQLRHIPAEEAAAMLPAEYNGASFIRINKNSNSLYLTGSVTEVQPIADFLALLDAPPADTRLRRFEIQYLKAADFISLLPRELAAAGPLLIPESNAFVVRAGGEREKQFEDYIALVDKRNPGIPIRLKYIKSEELFQHLPPSAAREELVVSPDPTLLFYTGTGEKQEQFMEQLKLIDMPKPQIRYQLLVIQYQRSENLNWNKSLTINSSSADPGRVLSGTFSNLFNINFDIISGFGYQTAVQLNLQLGEDKARVLADTTLNGISGQDIKFENTNTFRYRDTTIDPETGKPFYTGTTREITSGLVLGVNGWVSGDGMITMKVNAAISKQDDSGSNTSATTNPPPTSERVVNTQVRTKSGTPVVIGGLLQIEKTESVKKTPLLGSIPLIGKLFQDIDRSDVTTEMVIYIIPYVHHGEASAEDYVKKAEGYYRKYILSGEPHGTD